jgi:GNAT superfamily N-acetyltransferase
MFTQTFQEAGVTAALPPSYPSIINLKRDLVANKPAAAPSQIDSPADLLMQSFQDEPIFGLVLELEDANTETRLVELSNLQAEPRGKGIGTAAMQRLVSLADDHGISFELMIGAMYGTRRHKRLKRFYERFGFEIDQTGLIMTRTQEPIK